MGSEFSQTYARPVVLLLVGAVGALVSAFFYSNFSILQFDQIEAGELGTIMLSLIFVALVIERATEIYVNARIDPQLDNQALREKLVSEAKLRTARAAVSAERAASPPDSAAMTSRAGELTSALADYQAKVAAAAPVEKENEQVTRRKTSVFAMVLSILAALVGVRVLGPFLTDGQFSQCLDLGVSEAVQTEILAAVSDKLQDDATALANAKKFLKTAFAKTGCHGQPAFFSAVDVFLTGTLLAGGADGIHQIVKRFLSYSQKPAG